VTRPPLPPHRSQRHAADAAGCITVDLDALARNWRAAQAASGSANASAVVKADGYGLGLPQVSEALSRAGCSRFFVALPAEGLAVRAVAPTADIYVLNGPMVGWAQTMADAALIPVLNDTLQMQTWAQTCADAGRKLPAAVHLDTGMNRLGLAADDVAAVTADAAMMQAFRLVLVMSHLACADDPAHPLNALQRQRFDAMRRCFADAPASLSNSAGLFLGADYHYDLTRPGICLYGASPSPARPAPFEPVVSASAQVLQVRDIAAGDTIGYGATFTATAPMRTATVAAGYADGVLRSAGNRAYAAVNGVRVPYVGRVSMDLVVLDISAPEAAGLQPGDSVELIGPTIGVDDLAQAAGTIGYEVLTRLGQRYERRYASPAPVSASPDARVRHTAPAHGQAKEYPPR